MLEYGMLWVVLMCSLVNLAKSECFNIPCEISCLDDVINNDTCVGDEVLILIEIDSNLTFYCNSSVHSICDDS